MEALNAAGRRVSLLNDDGPHQPSSYSVGHAYATPPSGASSPTSPQLWRSGSYDSQVSGSDAVSPLTPALDYTYTSSQPSSRASNTKRPLQYTSSRSTSNEDDVAVAAEDRPAKRYPCRFRDSHGCEKTFTTSGHASRHSKIHTAEKAVQCTFSGCQKKFTRADNMKQHLETHYKDKSRSAGGHRSAAAAHHKAAVEHRRPSAATARSRSSSSLGGPELDVRQYALPTPPPLRSPAVMASGGRSAWELTGTSLPLHNRPSAIHAPKSGLDALAMAVACQESS
ncbi:Zinc finger, C2H2-type/integrase, DNA-binding protein [Cordyceps fumosorosea ARSEF 2679]|uniref:C2H2 type master regulator of conidiophore development brlA n=1 Tax=Cordyceps fumosorosea (strain ARSEF 2679) TaxID=1081104 RepID=A0A167WMI9_CORFA|nr:Zinc finger, C2H2-type/integrase, DNA-binding protein [Cordyceps fumosorosea ARSEF 2679]OAA63976.1 Zinc finger, C2H2-type/integrase, DNA-binding protein [Cordyceps fumosorosea ARSEF 2679]